MTIELETKDEITKQTGTNVLAEEFFEGSEAIESGKMKHKIEHVNNFYVHPPESEVIRMTVTIPEFVNKSDAPLSFGFGDTCSFAAIGLIGDGEWQLNAVEFARNHGEHIIILEVSA